MTPEAPGLRRTRQHYYADLIVGPLLAEIKTGHVTSDWDVVKAYRQLIDYREVVPAAGYPASTSGLYLAWYGLLLTWPVSRQQEQ